MGPIETVISVGASILGGAAIIRWTVKASIGHAFAAALEDKKHVLAQELQAQAAAAALSLERVRTELTLEAEVRRQTAVRKVDALVKLSAESLALVRAFHDTSGNADQDADKRLKALIAWGHRRVDLEVLLRPDEVAAVAAFEGAALQGHAKLSSPPADAGERAVQRHEVQEDLEGARLRLFEMLRRELQIVARGDLEKRA